MPGNIIEVLEGLLNEWSLSGKIEGETDSGLDWDNRSRDSEKWVE